MERHPHILTASKSGLIVIDVQEKFVPVIPGIDAIVQNIVRLVLGFQMFKRPILVTEQYPRGLGPTLDIIAKQFDVLEVTEKTCFSCCSSDGFLTKFNELGLESVVVTGVESHVCVEQTVLDLLQSGTRVHVAVDAIGSRHRLDHDTAIQKMVQAGAIPTTAEMVLFELAQQSGTQEFKYIQKMIKSRLKVSLTGSGSGAKTRQLESPAASGSAVPAADEEILFEEELPETLLDTVPAERHGEPAIDTGHPISADAGQERPESKPINEPPIEADSQISTETGPASPAAPKHDDAPAPKAAKKSSAGHKPARPELDKLDDDIASLEEILASENIKEGEQEPEAKSDLEDTKHLSRDEIAGMDIPTLEDILGEKPSDTK
jgi:nicotinamidase-related amidase